MNEVYELLTKLFLVYVTVEALFFAFQLYTARQLSARQNPIMPDVDRMKLLRKVLKQADEIVSIQSFIEGWFLDDAPIASIKKGNLEKFIAWAFFSTPPEKLTFDHKVEIEEMIQFITREYGMVFEPGFNPEAHCCCMTYEPLHFIPRSFLFYIALAMKRMVVSLLLQFWGFQLHTHKDISYYHKMPSHPTPDHAKPILFIHGLSTGWGSYMLLIHKFREREVFLVNVNQIAMKLDFAELIPVAFADTLLEVLEAHRVQSAIFCGHSFGSILVTWVLKVRPSIASTVLLLDPVCIGLSLPSVAVNVIYRTPFQKKWPATVMEWAIYLGASTEIGIANILRRHFWWYLNTLWLEEHVTENMKVIVGMAGNDEIACPEATEKIVRLYNKQLKAGTLERTFGNEEEEEYEEYDSDVDVDAAREFDALYGTEKRTAAFDRTQRRLPIDFLTFDSFSHAQILWSRRYIDDIYALVEKRENELFVKERQASF